MWIKEKAKQVWGKIKDAGSWVKRNTKKVLVSLGIIGVALAAGTTVNPEPILQEQIDEIIQEIAEKQEKYFKQHGRYWQGLSTNDLSKMPHYQDEGWAEFIDSGYLIDLPFEMIVNQYKAPGENYGYWIIIENDEVKKSVGYGIEADMHTWDIIKTATTTQ